jgi:hypothetical protein
MNFDLVEEQTAQGMADVRWIDRALQRIIDLTDAGTGSAYSTKLFRGVAHIDGSELKFKRFARASTKDELGDLNAELTFALLFVGLDFDVVFEPTGDKGPDLSVRRDGQSAYVEVKRFRPRAGVTAETAAMTDEPLLLQQFGQPEKDTNKVRGELYTKFRQVTDHNGILAIWSDDDDLEFLEHRFAVDDMRRDSETGIQGVPENILFSVFAGNWRSGHTGQQVYCRPFRPLADPFRMWAEHLDLVSVSSCVREALKKLSAHV